MASNLEDLLENIDQQLLLRLLDTLVKEQRDQVEKPAPKSNDSSGS